MSVDIIYPCGCVVRNNVKKLAGARQFGKIVDAPSVNCEWAEKEDAIEERGQDNKVRRKYKCERKNQERGLPKDQPKPQPPENPGNSNGGNPNG